MKIRKTFLQNKKQSKVKPKKDKIKRDLVEI